MVAYMPFITFRTEFTILNIICKGFPP